MKIRIQSSAFEKMFRAGKPLVADDLLPNGEPSEMEVELLTGFLLDMSGFLRHRKKFLPGENPGDDICGCNINRRNTRWGSFVTHLSVRAPDLIGNNDPVTCIDYAIKKNGRVTSRIRDLIRKTDVPGVYIGMFFYKVLGKYRFCGYFTLTLISKSK